jgi:UDP-glucose 4-epimerase
VAGRYPVDGSGSVYRGDMAGRRVLISGMGGELGSRVASMLEEADWVGELVGIDADPPRRRLHRSVFHRIPPAQHDRVVETVVAFNPHVVLHMAIWEPDARTRATNAESLNDDAATSVLGAAAECRALESVVVRSGIEIYGRGRNSLTLPDESSPIAPTSQYGRMLAGIEQTAADIGMRVGVPVTRLRLAPVIGPHVPSPLGRVLRQPVVPFSVLADPPFTVVHDSDAAAAFVHAAELRIDAPVNVVAPGSITTLQAIRSGNRFPLPLIGPEWMLVRRLSHLLGAPIPGHVSELFHRGRLADGGNTIDLLGVAPAMSTAEVIDDLHSWENVVRVPARRKVA